MSTLNLSLLTIDSALEYEGGVVLEIGVLTPGRKRQKVRLKMGPLAIGNVAEELHKVTKEQQRRLDVVKRKLRGED